MGGYAVLKADSSDAFVGREAELETLTACAAQAAAGVPGLVVVAGDAGIGKTALVRQALRALGGFAAWWASCDPSEQDWPYGVIEQWLHRADPRLTQESSVLAGHLGPDVSPGAAGAEMIDLLGRAQGLGPMVLVVDDVQWADEASVKTLGFVLRRLWADQVLVVVTARSRTWIDHGEVLQEGAWSGLARGAPYTHVLTLGGLSRPQVAELAFGSGSALSPVMADRLWSRTGGHPLYIRSILAVTAPEQLNAPDARLPVPDSLAAAVRQALEHLPGDSRTLIEALAVLDEEVSLALAGTVAGVEDPARSLGQLLETGLVSWAPTEPSSPVRIAHPLQRDAIYEAMGPKRRRALHAAAAPLVASDTVWHHRVAAADRTDADLASELEDEAGRMVLQSQLGRATTLLLWASDLSEGRAEHERRLLTAACYLHYLNSYDLHRADSLRASVEACAPSALRSCALGRYASWATDYKTAARHYSDARKSGDGDPTTRATERNLQAMDRGHAPAVQLARVYLGVDSTLTLHPVEAVAHLTEALEYGIRDPQLSQEARYMLVYSTALAHGAHRGLATLAEVADLPRNPRAVSGTDSLLLCSRGIMLALSGELQAARDDLGMLVDRTSYGSARLARVNAHSWLALCQYLLGQWDQAAAHADAAIAEGEAAGYKSGSTPGHSLACMVNAGQGRWQSAEEHLARSQWVPIPLFGHLPGAAEAALAQASGDFTRMLAALQAPVSMPPAAQHTFRDPLTAPLLVEALTATGRLDEAERALGRLRQLSSELAYLRPVTCWSTGALAEAHQESGEAIAAYREGLELGDLAPPFHRARIEQACARLEYAAGRRKEALVLAASAKERYTGLSATPFAQQVGADLAAWGARELPRTEYGLLSGLTEREHAVARLASQGMTNQEIARSLYVSAKTVEYHLGHVYAKLQIPTRRQLRDAFS
jgi:ATP/maltotriose-dependent transcriptional regulator MalT